MPEISIESAIEEVLTGQARKGALALVEHLRASDMRLDRAKGYWENQRYWAVSYAGQYVCFILIGGTGPEARFSPLTIWSDDSGDDCFADVSLDVRTQEVFWENVDICGGCGGCKSPGGTRRVLFGRAFDSVCLTALRFVNPDAEALACVQKMADIRRQAILYTSRL